MRLDLTSAAIIAATAGLAVAGGECTTAISCGVETLDHNVPASLASPVALSHRKVAEQLYRSLPYEHQHAIAEKGGIGPVEQLDALGVRPVDAPSIDTTASAMVAERLTPAVRARLAPELINILETVASKVDAGEPIPALCLAPDADRTAAEILETINNLYQRNTRFQQTGRWSNTAVDGGGLGQGDPTTLTYSYVPDGTFVPNLIGVTGNSNLFSWLNGIYGSPANWQPIFDQVFDVWAELIGTEYIYEPNDDGSNLNGPSGQLGVRGDVRIAAIAIDGNSGTLAYNNFPNDGDMVLDSADNFYNQTGNNSLRLRNIIAHEHGHGIGLLHVCPVNGTILMEPFINLGFDGPQLDDILSGQRHYGDNLENNDNSGEASPIGTITPTGPGIAGSVLNVSIDDNNDIDFYSFQVVDPIQVTFTAAPDADAYVQGTQTQFCDSGTFTDYNIVHNLDISVIDINGITPLAFSDVTGLGVEENLTIDIRDPGTYYVAVGGSNANSIQRYALTWLASVPPTADLAIGTITGVPEIIETGDTTDITVTISENDDNLVGTPQLNYRFDSGSFQQTPLSFVSGSTYTGTLPAGPCGSTVELFISAESQNLGTVFSPADGASDPLTAQVFDVVVAFEDNFQSDLGWTVTGPVSGANSGEWGRATPNGSGQRGEPATDFDGSGQCYLTGPGGPGANTDVDGGQTILTSPIFDLSDDPEAIVSYARWFDNTQGDNPASDVFRIQITNNGFDWVTLENVGPNDGQNAGGWFEVSHRVADFVTPSATTFIRFIAEDAGAGSVVEAAVDAIRIDSTSCPDVPDCAADLNGDGALNNTDINLFVSLFLAQDGQADLNDDGSWNNTDINLYVAAFLAGCPG